MVRGWVKEDKMERMRAELVVACFLTRRNGDLLLVRRGEYFTLPTGHMEFLDKSLEHALGREMKEELGPEVEISIRDTLGAILRNKNGATKVIQIFHCQVSAGAAHKILYEEAGQTGQVWIRPSQALALDLDELAREAVKRYLNKRRR